MAGSSGCWRVMAIIKVARSAFRAIVGSAGPAQGGGVPRRQRRPAPDGRHLHPPRLCGASICHTHAVCCRRPPTSMARAVHRAVDHHVSAPCRATSRQLWPIRTVSCRWHGTRTRRRGTARATAASTTARAASFRSASAALLWQLQGVVPTMMYRKAMRTHNPTVFTD